jgi:hypothetical protein
MERRMNDLQRLLTQDVRKAWNNLDDILADDSVPIQVKMQQILAADMDLNIAQWAASLDIKTKHDLMKSSIDGIR